MAEYSDVSVSEITRSVLRFCYLRLMCSCGTNQAHDCQKLSRLKSQAFVS